MLLDISIINYFDKGLSWDIFVQGFIVVLVLSGSFLYLLYLLPLFHKQNQSLIDFYLHVVSNKISSYFSKTILAQNSHENGNSLLSKFVKFFQLLSLSSVIIVVSFMTGTIFSNVSDVFMDQSNTFHLGLKKNWTTLNDDKNLIDTDEGLKIQTFNNIFGTSNLHPGSIDKALEKLNKKSILKRHGSMINYETRKDLIKELYYFSKHRILESDKWAGYLTYSQTLVNLNQTFCFSMWILLLFSFLGFVVTLIMSYKDRLDKGPTSNHSFFELGFLTLTLIFIIANVFLPICYATFSTIALFGIGLLSIIFVQFRVIRGFRLTTSLALTLAAITLYHITAIAWLTCEQECCAKTYGLLIYMDKGLSEFTLDVFKEAISN